MTDHSADVQAVMCLCSCNIVKAEGANIEIYQLPLISNALLYFDLINSAYLTACICIRARNYNASLELRKTQVKY